MPDVDRERFLRPFEREDASLGRFSCNDVAAAENDDRSIQLGTVVMLELPLPLPANSKDIVMLTLALSTRNQVHCLLQ